MTKGGFEMPNGRDVALKSFRLDSTYAGVLEGSPEQAGEGTLKQLRKLVEKNATGAWPIVLIEPPTLPLPSYQVTIRMTSSRGVRQSDPDYSSQLQIIGFVDSVDHSISDIINSLLPQVDWEASAADYDIMDF